MLFTKEQIEEWRNFSRSLRDANTECAEVNLSICAPMIWHSLDINTSIPKYHEFLDWIAQAAAGIAVAMQALNEEESTKRDLHVMHSGDFGIDCQNPEDGEGQNTAPQIDPEGP